MTENTNKDSLLNLKSTSEEGTNEEEYTEMDFAADAAESFRIIGDSLASIAQTMDKFFKVIEKDQVK